MVVYPGPAFRSFLCLGSLVLAATLVAGEGVLAQLGGAWSPPFNHRITSTGNPWEVHPTGLPAANGSPGATGVAQSTWVTSTPLSERMNGLHACVISVGPFRGHVLMWDGNLHAVGARLLQPWTIVNPYWTPATTGSYRFHNAIEPMPTDPANPSLPAGEFFCCGQCVLPNGMIVIAGGTKAYPVTGGHQWFGSPLVYVFDPNPTPAAPFGKWHDMGRAMDLEQRRWYPAVVCDATLYLPGQFRVLVLGGTDDLPPTGPNSMDVLNHYESYIFNTTVNPPTVQIEQKPGNPAPPPSARRYQGPQTTSIFTDYPRTHQLAIPSGPGWVGDFFVTGYASAAFRWQHFPTANPTFSFTTANSGQVPPPPYLGYPQTIGWATSLLYPGSTNLVARIGGMYLPNPDAALPPVNSDWLETTRADIVNNPWYSPPSAPGASPYRMLSRRLKGNVVILPNGQLFAVGGYRTDSENAQPDFVMTPELLVNSQQWYPMAPQTGGRGYHSCAVLLPDGRVFVSGGELRSVDYEIWSPPYLTNGLQQPQNVMIANNAAMPVSQVAEGGLSYGTAGGAPYTASWTGLTLANVARVVLMRPAALTHHDDGGQRYIELPSWEDPDTLTRQFNGPPSRFHAPPGWYMLFLVTNQGVPSNAYWVHLR